MSDFNDVEAAATTKETKPRSVRSRKKGAAVFGLAALIVAAAVVAYARLVLAGYESTDDAAINGDQVAVSAQVMGRIASMSASEGDPVAAGEKLVALDASSLAALETQAEADQDFAVQNVALAQVRLEQAQSDFGRATVQYQSRIIPQEQYDHGRLALETARTQLAIAEAQAKQAAARLATARVNLTQASISSPIDGVVARKWVSVGEIVQPAESIYTLSATGRLWVDANFKETQLRQLAVGDRAEIRVDALPGMVLKGRVESLGVVTASLFALIPAGNASGNYTKVTQRVPVKIAIDLGGGPGSGVGGHGSAYRLLPGMSAEVRVRTSKD